MTDLILDFQASSFLDQPVVELMLRVLSYSCIVENTPTFNILD